jgi:hypothetical protein
MRTIFALVLLFDLCALSDTSKVYIAKPISSDGVVHAHSFAPGNQTVPDHFAFGPRKHFDL